MVPGKQNTKRAPLLQKNPKNARALMKVSTVCRFALLSTISLLSGNALPLSLTPTQLQQFADGANADVIVILRDQVAGTPP